MNNKNEFDKPKRIIVKVGNSVGVVLDKFMLHDSEMKLGDELEYKCTKGKIVLKKIKPKEQ